MPRKMSLKIKILKTYYPTIIILISCLCGYLDWKLIAVSYILYCVYANYSSKTVLTFNKTAKNDLIIKTCQKLSITKFKPYFLIPTCFLQTLFFPFVKNPEEKLNFNTEIVNTLGSTITWVEFKSTKENFNLEDNRSILLILPGLTGGENDKYIINICHEGLKNNYKVVVYNNRMLTGDIMLREGKSLNLIDEFDSSLKFIENRCPNRKIFAVGFSYGANSLLMFLGLKNLNKDGGKRILGAVSIANPYDMMLCQRFISDTIYDNLILSFLKKKLRINIHRVKKFEKEYNLEVDKAMSSDCIKDYDEYLVRRVLGYKSADDYYRGMSCVHQLENIQVPTLCINALDDEITTPKSIPFDEFKLNDNFFSLCTDRGGHIVYIDNKYIFKLNHWVNEPILDFINALNKLNI